MCEIDFFKTRKPEDLFKQNNNKSTDHRSMGSQKARGETVEISKEMNMNREG